MTSSMPNTQTFSLLAGINYFVGSWSNAANGQTVVITPPSGSAATYTESSGNEYMAPIPLTTPGFLQAPSGSNQWAQFTTPTDAPQYTVTCTNTGTDASQIEVNTGTYSLPNGGQLCVTTVVSEDLQTGDDFNDSVTIFIGWQKPPSTTAKRR